MSVVHTGAGYVEEKVRALLEGRLSLEQARGALEVVRAREERRGVVLVAKEDEEEAPSSAGRRVVEKLTSGKVVPVSAREVVAAYAFAYRQRFAREDAELAAPAGHRGAVAQALAMVRRDFRGQGAEAARYVVRALCFWQVRKDEQRWPGPGMPTFDRMRGQALLTAWRKGEINSVLGKG